MKMYLEVIPRANKDPSYYQHINKCMYVLIENAASLKIVYVTEVNNLFITLFYMTQTCF